MRRFTISFFVFAFVFSICAFSVFAEDGMKFATSSVGPNDLRIGVGKEIRDKKEDLKEHEASVRAKLVGKFKRIAAKRLNNIGKHLSAYLSRLDRISNKIDNRIQKIKGQGVDTASAESKLAEAKVLGGTAKTAVDKAKTDIAAVADKATFESAISSINSARDALFAYYKGLLATLKELKTKAYNLEGSGSAR